MIQLFVRYMQNPFGYPWQKKLELRFARHDTVSCHDSCRKPPLYQKTVTELKKPYDGSLPHGITHHSAWKPAVHDSAVESDLQQSAPRLWWDVRTKLLWKSHRSRSLLSRSLEEQLDWKLSKCKWNNWLRRSPRQEWSKLKFCSC